MCPGGSIEQLGPPGVGLVPFSLWHAPQIDFDILRFGDSRNTINTVLDLKYTRFDRGLFLDVLSVNEQSRTTSSDHGDRRQHRNEASEDQEGERSADRYGLPARELEEAIPGTQISRYVLQKRPAQNAEHGEPLTNEPRPIVMWIILLITVVLTIIITIKHDEVVEVS